MSRYDHPADDSAYMAATSDQADRYPEDDLDTAIDPLALAEGDLVGAVVMMRAALAEARTCSAVALLRSHCQRWERMFVTLADLAADADDRVSRRGK